jgi:hypothetical protein
MLLLTFTDVGNCGTMKDTKRCSNWLLYSKINCVYKYILHWYFKIHFLASIITEHNSIKENY